MTITEGTDSRNRLWVYPLDDVAGRTVLGDPIKIIDEAVAEMLDRAGRRAALPRDRPGRTRGRVVWTDPCSRPVDGTADPVVTEVYRPGEDTLLAVRPSVAAWPWPRWPM